MLLLDQYVLKKFLVPFLYCIIGFIAIWLIWDLSTNAPDFVQGHITFGMLLKFYATQIPAVIVLSMPIGTLLALLYSFAQMSRRNEIISMLCCGRSLYRIFLPFFFVGLLLVLIVTYFNYAQAPQAEVVKNQMKEEIKTGIRKEQSINTHLFRNRVDNRTWYLQSLYVKDQLARQVQIIQQDTDGNILEKWYAETAHYDPSTHTWLFHNVDHVLVNPVGNVFKFDHSENLEITNWSESPWRIASSVMKPDFLSVPELNTYLTYNSDFPKARLAPFFTHRDYRWALPWASFIVIFIAGPLSVVTSRRGIMGGVALAIGLFSALLFSSSLFLALGKGDRCPPWIAAWGPNIIFMAIGLFLLWIKATGRELPKLSTWKKMKLFS
ncbi:MAG TPA: LptF/LptG family permease [Chthoniobacterales bacterium]|nr:LptF/LptG family permease [Chthoniobacterales bacterium]